MYLHNTMTREIEELRPIDYPHVRLYTCGPTVYHHPQIGNWATYIRWDTLVRVLRLSGYDVNWVMNITDVGHLTSDGDEGEDKLEKGARREGKSAWDVAAFYTHDFLSGMLTLNIRRPTVIARATEHIPEQIALIKQLEAKGYTYMIDDGVYFDTEKLSDYGKLARLHLESLKAGARVEINQQKRNPADFALWKFSPLNEQRDMEWWAPWSRHTANHDEQHPSGAQRSTPETGERIPGGWGFPGWHLECSAMAMKYLGETLDIHAGGIDFIPVHHTNEIAQSEAATGKPFAHIWVHGNFITVDGVKLSKSLGNSYTLHDIIERGYDPMDLRLLFLQSHYRTQADFTWTALESARERRKELQALADLRWQLDDRPDDEASEMLNDHQAAMLRFLQHDLGTPQLLAELSAAEERINALGTDLPREPLLKFLQFLDDVLGLQLLGSKDITADQKQRIADRQLAREAKDFAKADQLRAELHDQGIGLRDMAARTLWYRI